MDAGPYLDAAVAQEMICDYNFETYCPIDRPICCLYEDGLTPGDCIAEGPGDVNCNELVFVQGETGCLDHEADELVANVCPAFRPYCCRGRFGATDGICQDHPLYSTEFFTSPWECTTVP